MMRCAITVEQKFRLGSLLLLLLSLAKLPQATGLRFANTYGDHMVLQAGSNVSLWGYGIPGATVTVTSSSNELPTSAIVSTNETWQVQLAPSSAGNMPHTLTATSGTQTITLRDILFGDVCE
jgi:sialate O-acetylesterase